MMEISKFIQYLALETRGDIILPKAIELLIDRRLKLEEMKRKFSSNIQKVISMVNFEEEGHYDYYMKAVIEGLKHEMSQMRSKN